MVESVTLSLSLGIIGIVIAAIALTRALKRRARRSRGGAPPSVSTRDRLRSRKAG